MVLKKGSAGDDVRRLQQGLTVLGFPCGEPDGDYGQKTADAVREFQSSHSLNIDGEAGTFVLQAYNIALRNIGTTAFLVGEDTPAMPAPAGLLAWTKCPADKYADGYGNTTLRSDVAEAYNALYADVQSLGGMVTSAGGRRDLATTAGANQSKLSFHYVGRAFDMAISSGLRNPTTDPFVLMPDGRKWIVWGRSRATPADLIPRCQALGIKGGSMVLTAAYMTGKAQKIMTVHAPLFNFTELARKHGFERISSRSSFVQNGDVMGAEWWHFEWETGMVEGQTTFGEELGKVYSPADCQRYVYWNEVKDARFKVEWL